MNRGNLDSNEPGDSELWSRTECYHTFNFVQFYTRPELLNRGINHSNTE